MWVVELDRPWLGTPFDFQGFPITSEEQLESVRSYCQHVYVDPERESLGPLPRKRTSDAPSEEDLVVAREVYDECEKAVKKAFVELKDEAKLDTDRLAAATVDIAQTIQRNPDAVILLHRL